MKESLKANVISYYNKYNICLHSLTYRSHNSIIKNKNIALYFLKNNVTCIIPFTVMEKCLFYNKNVFNNI